MPVKRKTIVCSFQSGPDVTKKTTYEELKAAVLTAGRFSAFEASENRYSCQLYTRLSTDPDIELDNKSVGFPWVIVRRKTEEPK